MSQIKWVIVAELALDSGTEYFSGERVRRIGISENIIYAGTVQRWGTIEKSIPSPPGMPQISDAQVRIADNFRKWRDLLAHQTPRRRIMQLTLMPEGASIADYDPIYVGEIIDVAFEPAAIEISLRDRLFAWLDEPFPALAVRDLYPDISPEDNGGFIPIINGECRSVETSPETAQGVVPLPHLGYTGTLDASPPDGVDRWAIACHPVLAVVAVYRRETVTINEDIDVPEWVLVDPSEYVISETEFTAAENVFGFGAFSVTNLDFLLQQPVGTEIRADVDGIDVRGGWGDLPAFITSPPSVTRNPIDFFINMTYVFMVKAGLSEEVFDTDEIGALRTEFESLGYLCDGAITEALTAREILGRFLPSFHLDMFVNRQGKITLRHVTNEDDPTRPVFKEGKHILRESFRERLPDQISNQVQYRYEYNNAIGEFQTVGLIENTYDQAVLRLNDVDKLEKEIFDMYFVRDATTAEAIADLRNQFMRLGSYRQECRMPAPAVFENIELANLVGWTHSMGLETGGYVNRQAKILSYALDVDQLEFTVHTVLFPPQSVALEEAVRPRIAEEWEDNPPVNPSRSHIDDGYLAIDDDAPVGESATKAAMEISSVNSIATYCQLFLYDVPEPFRELVSVTFFVDAEYVVGTPTIFPGFPDFPIVEVCIFDMYLNDIAGEPYITHRVTTIYSPPDSSMDDARAIHSYTMTGAAFVARFGTAANIYFRANQHQELLENFSPPCQLIVWDAWVHYEYA